MSFIIQWLDISNLLSNKEDSSSDLMGSPIFTPVFPFENNILKEKGPLIFEVGYWGIFQIVMSLSSPFIRPVNSFNFPDTFILSAQALQASMVIPFSINFCNSFCTSESSPESRVEPPQIIIFTSSHHPLLMEFRNTLRSYS